MTLSIISSDGSWVLGADGLTPEDLKDLKPDSSRRPNFGTLEVAMQRASIRQDVGGRGSRGELIEAKIPRNARVIAKNEDVVIYENGNGAIVIQQRYVKRKKVARTILVRTGRNGAQVLKEKVVQTVTEKPAVIMVPAMYAENAAEYLELLILKDRRIRKLVRSALKLLRASGIF